MRRREFITLLGGAVAAWPLAARAQQAGKLPTIGILGSGSAAWSHLVSALVQRLRELGYIENRSVAIEYRWTEGRSERYAAIAAELVRLKVDVIVALGTPAIVAAKKATAVIPIVFLAVWALMTNSNLLDCTTGNSAGLARLRIGRRRSRTGATHPQMLAP